MPNFSKLCLLQTDHMMFRHWVHLYNARFPYQQKVPVTQIAKSIRKRQSNLSGLIDHNTNQWAGFTLTENYSNSVLLAYLATAPNYEKQGVARSLVHDLKTSVLTENTPYLWLEASPKLRGFYQKLGFKRVAVEYRIPEVFGSGTEKMDLFVRMHKSVTTLQKETLYEFIKELLLAGYGLKKTDPRFMQQMQKITSYPDTVVSLFKESYGY